MRHRPAVGARTLSDREIREKAGHRDELPEGHQSVLLAAQRRRPDGRPLPNPPPRAGEGGVGGPLAPGIGEIIGGSQREERLDALDSSMAERGIAASTTPGTATCAATARCRMPASASASSAPSPTSPTPTSATRSPSRAPPATRGIEACCFSARVCVCHLRCSALIAVRQAKSMQTLLPRPGPPRAGSS
jgi:hypothetical protein